jgi:hypothetical protein
VVGDGFKWRTDAVASGAGDRSRQSAARLSRGHAVRAPGVAVAADGAFAGCTVLVVASGTIWLAAGALPGDTAGIFRASSLDSDRGVCAVLRYAPDVPVRAGAFARAGHANFPPPPPPTPHPPGEGGDWCYCCFLAWR